MLVDTRRRSVTRLVWTLILGFFLGGLFTKLAVVWMPEGAPRTFVTTAITASVGPLSVDLVAVAFVLGPVTLSMNVLTLLGIVIVAFVARSWI